MGLRVLRRSMHVAMPWKDGGGTTFEVMSWPPGCALTNFDWRVSFARVEGSGPFSRFQGVDRVITLVEGDQLVLSVRDVGVALGPFTPFSFAGEDEVTSSVMGAITDLNVMTRRGRFKAEVTTRRVDDEGLELEPAPGAVESLVAVLDGQITAVTTRGASVDLKPLDVISGYCAPLALSGLGVVEVISVLAADS